MAKPVAKAQVVRKQWIPILAPKLFNDAWIGESLLTDPQLAIGRFVTVSMTTLTNDIQKQHINLSFRINGFQKDVLTTELIGYHFSPSSARRFVRRARSKLDDSFLVTTQDGKKMRIKPMLVTRSKTQGGVQAALRKATRDFFTIQLSKMKLEQFWGEIIGHNLQKSLSDSLKKIYPVAAAELRWVLIAGEGIAQSVVEAAPVPVESPKAVEHVLEEAIADAQ